MIHMDRLPEHAFPLQNLELERTDLFWRIGRGVNKPRILIGLSDPGEAQALLPVLKRLINEPCDLFVLAESRGKEALESANIGFVRSKPFSPLHRISSLKADAIITGSATAPGTELALTANGQASGIPVIWLEEYPGGIFPYYWQNKPIPTHKSVMPDWLFVANEWAKNEELKYIPTFNPSRIIVTGQPAYDSIITDDREKTRVRIRQALKINPDEKLIVYMGIPTIASAEALEVLVKSINSLELRNYRLVNRLHPRDITLNQVYDEITQPVRAHLANTVNLTTGEIAMAADLVVTTYSSTGLEAVLRGIPSIHILIKDILAKSESGSNRSTPPPVLDGSSLAVYQADEMSDALNQALFHPEALRQKMSRWKIDGDSAQRVTELVLKIAREHKTR